MSKSNITQTVMPLDSLMTISSQIQNVALPCATYLKLAREGGELWQKLEDAALAAREFLNNHNAVIEPMKREVSNV